MGMPGWSIQEQKPTAVTADEWTENRPTSRFGGPGLGELWVYRELIGFLALRDIKVRYKQAAFGVLWAIIQPVAGAVVFTIVFRKLADVPSNGIPYILFAFLGFAVWSYVATSLTAAQDSLVDNAALVTKVYFPRLAAPVASVLPGLMDLGFSLVIFAGIMIWHGEWPGPEILLAPLFLVAMVGVTLGAGLWLATLNVQYRDVRYAYGLITQLWLFASPVAYPASLVKGGWSHVYALNPMVGVLEGMRWAVLDGPWIGVNMAISMASGLVLLVSGLAYFRKTERRFADVI